MHPKISEKMLVQHDWHDFYRDISEAIHGDMPVPWGNPILTHCYVDASHGSDKSTRRSQTGVLIICNKAPIVWLSKRQKTVETSTFRSKLQAMKNAVELIEGLPH